MHIHLDVKEIVLNLSLNDRLLLSVFLLETIRDYVEMFQDDSGFDQYRRFIFLDECLTFSLDFLSLIDPESFNLSAD
jgi:hypothetical protein